MGLPNKGEVVSRTTDPISWIKKFTWLKMVKNSKGLAINQVKE
jgi:hypothetical protein